MVRMYCVFFVNTVDVNPRPQINPVIGHRKRHPLCGITISQKVVFPQAKIPARPISCFGSRRTELYSPVVERENKFFWFVQGFHSCRGINETIVYLLVSVAELGAPEKKIKCFFNFSSILIIFSKIKRISGDEERIFLRLKGILENRDVAGRCLWIAATRSIMTATHRKRNDRTIEASLTIQEFMEDPNITPRFRITDKLLARINERAVNNFEHIRCFVELRYLKIFGYHQFIISVDDERIVSMRTREL